MNFLFLPFFSLLILFSKKCLKLFPTFLFLFIRIYRTNETRMVICQFCLFFVHFPFHLPFCLELSNFLENIKGRKAKKWNLPECGVWFEWSQWMAVINDGWPQQRMNGNDTVFISYMMTANDCDRRHW